MANQTTQKQPGADEGAASATTESAASVATTARPAILTPNDVANAAAEMVAAFAQSIAGFYRATGFEHHAFSQLVEDIHRYNLDYQHGDLTSEGAQVLIHQAVDRVQSILVTARQLRRDALQIAMHAALGVLDQLIKGALSAAFAGFKFTL